MHSLTTILKEDREESLLTLADKDHDSPKEHIQGIIDKDRLIQELKI